MEKKTIAITLFSLPLLINWASTPETKNALFFGTVITHQDNTFAINNITIGDTKKTKEIPLYEKPQSKNNAPETVTLTNDPKNTTIYVNLSTIASLQVPHPDTVWVYQKEKESRKHSYIEIVLTEKNNTETSYLIELDTPIYADRIQNNTEKEENETKEETKKVKEKMKINIIAIKKLILEGYTCPPENMCLPSKITQKTN